MEVIYRSSDGREFQTVDECIRYEERLLHIVEALIDTSLVEKTAGDKLAGILGVGKEFLHVIRLIDKSLSVVTSLEGARHLAAYSDEYIALGQWLEEICGSVNSTEEVIETPSSSV